jgi:hypothetical protein
MVTAIIMSETPGSETAPVVPEIVKQDYVADGLRIGYRADGALLVVFGDVERETVRHWADWAREHSHLLFENRHFERQLYGLRLVRRIPLYAVQSALRAGMERGGEFVRMAILVPSESVSVMIATITHAIPVQIRIFTNAQEAELWLHAGPE